MRVWKVSLWLVLFGGFALPASTQDYPRYRAIGSTYVPLDSWVYPAFERLATMGYVTTSFAGMKPWTRTECARLVEETSEAIQSKLRADLPVEEAVAELHQVLEREFLPEITALGGGPTRSLRVDSVYARVLSISGPPLTDGFHFGQTVSYDFGRPNRRGTNTIAGGSGSATAGPFFLYVSGEFQHAPSAPALTDAQLDFIAQRDQVPRPAATPFQEVNRGRLLDAYAGVNFKNWLITVGQQSISWGSWGEDSLLLSRNADPLFMVRAARAVPYQLPWIFRRLGPIRTDSFIAKLEGHQVFPDPYLVGTRVTLKPSRYLEIGLGETFLLGGRGGDPFTFDNFFRALIGRNRASGGTHPGDGRNHFSLVFYVPGLRNSAAIFGELMGEESLGFKHPTRAPWRTGLYVARVPGLSRMDAEFEVVDTRAIGDLVFSRTPGRSYWNFEYRDGYTNNGVLLGNTVGRMGRAVQFSTNYWLSPQHKLGFVYKHNSVRAEFTPGGARWDDYKLKHEIHLRSGMYVKSSIQFEPIRRYPILFSGSRNNVTAAIELGFLTERSRP